MFSAFYNAAPLILFASEFPDVSEINSSLEGILEEIFTCMKKGEQVTFEIRGKMKNIVVSVPKSDVDNAIEVWDIYKQM